MFQQIGAKHPDAIMVGGLVCEYGGQLIKDKVSVLGATTGRVKLLLPDGFPTQSTIDDAGADVPEGAFMSVGGVPVEQLTRPGASFGSDFQAKYGPDAVDPHT